jgi:hypothetical protein
LKRLKINGKCKFKLADSEPFPILLLTVQTVLPLAILSFIVAGYRGVPFTELLSFVINDGHCILPEGIGSHCFGDFGFPRNSTFDANTFLIGFNWTLSNTPFALWIFFLFSKITYNLGLAIYQVLLIFCVVYPIWNSTKKYSTSTRIQSSIYLGLLSIGTISMLDRGNHIGFMIFFTYMYLNSSNPRYRVVYLILLLNLKYWAPLLLIIPLAQKRYKELVYSLIIVILSNLFIIQLVTSNTLLALKNILITITEPISRDHLSQYTISLQGLISRIFCINGSSTACTGANPQEIFPPMYVTIMIALVFIAISFLVASRTWLSDTVRFSPAIILTFLIVPEGPIYQISMLTVILTLIAKDSDRYLKDEVIIVWLLVFCSIISVVPIAGQFSLSESLGSQRYFYWLYPAIWTLVMACYVKFLYKTKASAFRNNRKFYRILKFFKNKSPY